MAGWLRRILTCNIVDARRANGRKKRDAALERPLDATLDLTCSRLEMWLEAVQTSPSVRVSKAEQLILLAAALDRLTSEQRQAIELHHLHGLTLQETAERLGRSIGSTVGHCRRGLARLRELLQESNGKQ